jgi:histidinol dehydrogenase
MWKQLDIEEWNGRRRGSLEEVREPVERIIAEVRDGGDEALFELTARYDKVQLEHLKVTVEETRNAYTDVDEGVVSALSQAKANIEAFHRMQRPPDLWTTEVGPGLVLGVKTTPLDRVGVYVPGGRASYPSTVLMCTVPAKVAGVPHIIMCTPPPVSPLTIVAADLAGVNAVYTVGGAQAIAAMALGTRTIPPVHKIVGPGNVYVTMAKMLLRDRVEIDSPAGPSEIAVLADRNADPRFIAADILAQAEHDPKAACVLVTTDEVMVAKVGREIEKLLARADRREIIDKALQNCGYVLAKDLASGVELINFIAPEHLSIQVLDPQTALRGIRNAGSIFVGKYAAVALGDYASGTNHVLPTAGHAQVHSGLDVGHFMKRSSVQIVDREGLESIGNIVETLARAEGLHAHARSVAVRREKDEKAAHDEAVK